MRKPDAWMLRTGHGSQLRDELPVCEVPEAWQALYRITDSDRAVLLEASQLAQRQSQRHESQELEALAAKLREMAGAE